MKRLLLIYNPTAGKMQFSGKLSTIVDRYTKQDYIVTVYPTQKSQDGYRFVKQYAKDFDLIVCAGGDGTLNEIISGLLDAKIDKTIGYIPCGSTNDFARSLNIPVDIQDAVEITCGENAVCVDIGSFNDKHFVYVAGFGLFTNVSYATSQKMKNSLGYLAYILEGIKALSEVQSHEITLTYGQGVIHGEFIIGLIMNSFSVGGFKSPYQSLTQLEDGLFEVILVRMPKNIQELQMIITALMNGGILSEYVVCIQSSELTIQSKPMEWTLDGEYGGQFEAVEIKNLNAAAKILTGIQS